MIDKTNDSLMDIMERASAVQHVTLRCHKDMWKIINDLTFVEKGLGEPFPNDRVVEEKFMVNVHLSGVHLGKIIHSMWELHNLRRYGHVRPSTRATAKQVYTSLVKFVQEVNLDDSENLKVVLGKETKTESTA